MSISSRFAKRLADIEPFRVVDILARAKALEAEGKDIVHMEAGEPDFATAEPIIRAGQQALAEGKTYYTQATGLPELKEALAIYYEQKYGVNLNPRRILITPGASGALLLMSALLIDRDQGMLMADPGYPCNRNFMRLVEGEGQLVPAGPAERYQLTPETIASHWRENTVGALVASPANPTGGLLSLDELSALYQAVSARNGTLVVDELYHGLTYGVEAESILQKHDDAFVINSFSKYFGMTGWRLGWMVVPEEAVSELEKLAQNLFISLSTVAQYAALAAFQPATREILDQRRDIFAERRDFLLPSLRNLGFDIPVTPEGGFYIYANVERLTDSSTKFCRHLLDNHGLAITPGNDFGRYRAEQHLRFSYTTGMEQLEKAVERLALALR